MAQRVATGLTIGRGRLDLDHLGAELGEHLPRERTGNELAHFDDLDPFQRLFRAHSSLRSTTACANVPLSTYSSSPPTGTPRAMRLTLMSRPRSISPI